MEPITISVPIYIQTSKKSKFALNLNQYRNAHYHELNKAKVMFNDLMQPLMKSLPLMSSLKLTYSLFFGSKRAVDTANICCIVDKFFSDSLVHAGKIPDDNTSVISDIHYRFGGIDKQNPRIDVTIHDYEVVMQNEEEDSMRIILVQSEIEEAIKAYVLNQITVKEGQEVNIDFKNTRGDDGATAEINIGVPKAGTKETNKPAPLEPVKTAPTNGQTTGTATVQPVAEASTSTAQTAPVATTTASEEVATVTPTNATSTPVSASNTAPEQVAAQAEAEAVVKPDAPTPTKSLFAGLTKPVNG